MTQQPNPAVRLVALLLVAGGAFGTWKWLGRANGVAAPAGPAGARPEPQRVADLPDGSIVLLTSPSKSKTLQAQAALFQSVYPRCQIVVRTLESRDGLQAILSGAVRPNLYSPSESGMVTSLNAAWKARHGRPLINTSSLADDATVAETSVVFLTTAARAPELEKSLTGKAPFSAVAGHRFSIANPVTSGSGLAALGRIQADAKAAKVPLGKALEALRPGLIYDDPARSGSSQLLEAFLGELTSQGGVSEREFIVAYESSALAAAAAHPELKLAVIYPKPAPTALSRVCVLSAPGGSGAEEAIAQGFVRFLKTPAAQRLFVDEGLRPRFAPDTRALPAAAGFRTLAATERAPEPDYNALMDAAVEWGRRWP